MLQSARKMANIKLVNKWDGRFGCKSLISSPAFKRRVIFSENLVAIEQHKTNIFYNRPIIVASAILEQSKIKMYEFYYEILKPHFKDDLKLLYTDTDSFLIHIRNHDMYEFIKNHIDEFDTSEYESNNLYGIPLKNAKCLGKWKDEGNGRIIESFIGLRSKMYSIKFANNKVVKRAKGVKKNIINKKITFNDYVECLQKNCKVIETQNLIKSHLHRVYSIEQSKHILDANDDKRYILPDRVSTLAFGHHEIGKQ